MEAKSLERNTGKMKMELMFGCNRPNKVEKKGKSSKLAVYVRKELLIIPYCTQAVRNRLVRER